jgi:hypothetical protein
MNPKFAADELAKYRIPDDDSDDEIEPITSVTSLTPELIERYVAKKARPKSLNLVCGRSACDEELHTFRPLSMDLSAASLVPCTKCGFELIGHDPSAIRMTRDAERLFALLQREWIRHFFFHLPLTDRIRQYAIKHGRQELLEIAVGQLRSGRMIGYSPRWDSQQTAMLRGTIVHWARHAVACCCRRCMAYWHAIPMSATLAESDIEYFQGLIMRYIDLRLPDLPALPHVKKAQHRSTLSFKRAD